LKLVVTHTYSFFPVEGLTAKQLRLADTLLSFLVKDAFHIDAVKRHLWDGRKHLLKKIRKNRQVIGYKFPTGLVRNKKLMEALGNPELVWENGYGLTKFERPTDEEVKYLLEDITLRDYQIYAVQKMLKRRRGVIQAAVASGKTEIAAAVIKYLNVPTVVMVPKLEILHQTRTRYAKRLGISKDEIGIIGESKYVPKRITVASVDSLRSMITRNGGYVDDEARRFYEEAKLVIFDEAHMVSDNTFFAVFMGFTKAEFRFGMSATPFDREDDTEIMLIGASSNRIVNITPDYLMKRGFIAIPDITMLKVGTPKLSPAYNYQTVVQEGIVDNPIRNDAIVQLVKQHKKRKILVMFRYIRHGRALSRLLYDQGIDHKIIQGDVEGEDREIIREEFENGSLNIILASVGATGLGTDLPGIEVLIRGDGGKAKISTIQILGRALRISEGKSHALVYDFYDDTHRYLRRHSKKRREDYKNIGDLVKVNQIDLSTGQGFLVL